VERHTAADYRVRSACDRITIRASRRGHISSVTKANGAVLASMSGRGPFWFTISLGDATEHAYQSCYY